MLGVAEKYRKEIFWITMDFWTQVKGLILDDSREANLVWIVYDGCGKFSDERVAGQHMYEFWTFNQRDCSQDK